MTDKSWEPDGKYSMTLEEIIEECRNDSANWFPRTSLDLFFQASCAMAEMGELVNLLKKVERGTDVQELLQSQIVEEATDAFIYLMCVFGLLEVDPEESYHAKRAANAKRFGRTAQELAL